MDSAALDTFLAVHRCGGVSAAALALSRTQSAISRRLALLEAEVGAPLFDRVGRGLVLSVVGAALLPHAERVAAELGDARAAVAAARAGQAGTLRIVCVGTLAGSALAAVLAQLRARLPGLDLRLHTATSAEVSAQVRSGAANLGLRYFEDRSPDLLCQRLHEEALQVVCAPGHARAGRRLASLSALAGERWLGFPVPERRSEAFAASVQAQFLARGMADIDWLAVDGLTAQKRLVEAGFGLALMQTEAVAEELARGTLAQIRVADLDLRIPVVSVVRRGGHLGEAARQALAALKTLGRAA
jgi:DNA-binding transcriptional LysR family regulator